MKKLMVSVAAVAFAGAVSASITNKWNDASGYGVEKFWNDPANWWEGHGESDPSPASSVPTEKSKYTLLQKDASITLQAGDDLKVGSLYFGATGLDTRSTSKHIDLTIPTGATLSLEGTDVSSWMGTSDEWQDGAVNNSLLLDVNGGTLNFGQKLFLFQPNMSIYMSPGYNHLIVRNGGMVNITNGYLRLCGGSLSDQQGRLAGTNIIDVCAGSKIRLVGDTSINFGIERFYGDSAHSPWGSQSYRSGGWLNVTGGEIDASENTSGYAPIIMGVNGDSSIGAYLNVTDGGLVNLGGKEIEILSNGKNLIRVASGGVITNGIIDVERGLGATPGHECLIDVDGGQVFLNWFGAYAHRGIVATDIRSTIRIHGGDSQFNVGNWLLSSGYSSAKAPPFFFDFKLKPHTLRNAEFALRPVNVRLPYYSATDNRYIPGYQRLSPEGGLQLVHEKTFQLHTRTHDKWIDPPFLFDGRYGGVIGDEMWSTNVDYLCDAKWTKYAGYAYVWAYQLTLKDEAKLADGQVLENPVPRAWFALPAFTDRMLNTNKYERISLRLDLVPQGDATLESLVAEMKANGQEGAVVESGTVGGHDYNVRVDLPVEELGVNAANDSIVMDFVKVDTYPQACQAVPFQTNALIRAACCDMKKIERGAMMILR